VKAEKKGRCDRCLHHLLQSATPGFTQLFCIPL